MRYADPGAGFFVSSDGSMCFRPVFTAQRTSFDNYYRSVWCLMPNAVSKVYSLGSDEVDLTCKHADPQCLREIEGRQRIADTGHVHIVPANQEKLAVEHLIYLMGGNLGDSHPFK
jgi:hypothetical protein